MSIAVISLLALVAAIVLSMTSRLNVGLVAIALAWIIGVYVAGMRPDAVMAGFPVSLFLTLAGVTLLFATADTNGTLERLAYRTCALAHGNTRALPILFFFIAFVVSTVGPGAISSVALIVPLAMAIGDRAGVPRLLTALMVANGANAGNLSPVASVGIIANSAMARVGLGGHEWRVWFANLVAHAAVAILAYVLFGRGTSAGAASAPGDDARASAPLDGRQRLTVAVIVLWIVGVTVFKISLGLGAFAAATLLLIVRAAEERESIRQVPWGVILMVSGVSLLVALLEETGGLELFTTLLARLATPETLNGVIAFVTGAISTYSSTSGVVLPAFLPTVTGLVEKVGGGDPLAVALSVNVGSALVDVSPLSTLGALCVAAVADATASRRLFNHLMIWGMSMTIVGGVFCFLFAGLLAGS